LSISIIMDRVLGSWDRRTVAIASGSMCFGR